MSRKEPPSEPPGAFGSASLEELARDWPAGSVLFEEGEPGRCMYVVREGKVKIAKLVAGAEVTLAVLGPGDFFGEMALLEKLPRSATATTLTEARLIEVDEGAFEGLLRRSSELSVRLMRRLCARLREADRQIHALLAKSESVRVLELLRSLAEGPDEQGRQKLPAGLTQDEIAARAGLAVGDVARVLDRLSRAGIVATTEGRSLLAPEHTLADYALYLELQETYDPLTASELSELSGIPEEEVHRIVRRLLEARLKEPGRPGARRLMDTYQKFLELKRRFEYPR